MKLVIAGGTGFVGRHLQDVLFGGQHSFPIEEVAVTGREWRRHRGPARFFAWEAGSKPFPDIKCDALIHAATAASAFETHSRPDAMFHEIVDGARRIADWCSRQLEAPRVLFLSSGAVYGSMPVGLDSWTERAPVADELADSTNAYERGKKAAEAVFKSAAEAGVCRLTIARLFAFSGRHLPLDRHFALGNFVRDALESRDIDVRGSGSAVRSYLDGDDLAYWLLTALSSPLAIGEILHFGSEVAISIRELAELVADRTGRIFGVRPNVKVHGQTSSIDGYDRYVPNTLATRELLGVSETVALAESIDDMLRFRSAERGRLR